MPAASGCPSAAQLASMGRVNSLTTADLDIAVVAQLGLAEQQAAEPEPRPAAAAAAAALAATVAPHPGGAAPPERVRKRQKQKYDLGAMARASDSLPAAAVGRGSGGRPAHPEGVFPPLHAPAATLSRLQTKGRPPKPGGKADTVRFWEAYEASH